MIYLLKTGRKMLKNDGFPLEKHPLM